MPSSSASSGYYHWTTVAIIASLAAATGGVVVIASAIASRRRLRLRRRDDEHDDDDDDDGDGTRNDRVGVGGTTTKVVEITLPEWADETSAHDGFSDMYARRYESDEEMMSLAIRISEHNVTMGTGGPFGACIFERKDGGHCELISVGMNRVVPLRNSTLHGEMVAIQLAQARLNTFTLSGVDGIGGDDNNVGVGRKFELFTSCEPCAMCLGGTLWSGVSRLVCAATKHDAQSIGFDEGPVSEGSYEHLENAGVEVRRNVMRDEAAGVLRRYGEIGLIYNRCPSGVSASGG
ncbi:hypothetical protein ACHAXA_002245 [Cyclostephanos tholiformis]|uniref:CMP/dCMP-type deaminase domain-containing protein n=1 Tax=Cyclostephanos tholiformis TaxID=382380 RepID=A0ABD3R8B6_9STRA